MGISENLHFSRIQHLPELRSYNLGSSYRDRNLKSKGIATRAEGELW